MLLGRYSVFIVCLLMVTTVYHLLKGECAIPVAPLLPEVAPLPRPPLYPMGPEENVIRTAGMPYRRRGRRV